MLKKIIFTVIYIFLGLPVIATSVLIIDWLNEKNAGISFDKIQLQDSEDSVIKMMGKPDSVTDCGDNLWFGDDNKYLGPNNGQCIRLSRYEYFLSAWAIGYSKDNKVVSKYHYVSE